MITDACLYDCTPQRSKFKGISVVSDHMLVIHFEFSSNKHKEVYNSDLTPQNTHLAFVVYSHLN